jgi:hypothetical protein
MKISIFKHLGNYSLTDNKKSWVVNLVCGDLRLNEHWDEDDEPATENAPPSDIVEIIAAKTESYWIDTSREKKREVINKLREMAVEIDRAWAEQEVERLEMQIEGAKRRIEMLKRNYIAEQVEVEVI